METAQRILIYQPLPKASRIKIFIPYPLKEEREQLKAINTSFYHPNQKLWSLVNTKENWELIQRVYTGKFEIRQAEKKVNTPVKTLNQQSVQALADLEQKLTLKAYSPSTIKNYTSSLSQFLGFFESRSLKDITKEEIEAFVYHQITKYKISESAQNTLIYAIKAYYEHVLGRERTVYDIQRPKKSMTLPNILSQEEVKAVLQSVENLKHRAILMLIYSAGLRISEAIKLRNRDIHSDEGYIFIKRAKNKGRRVDNILLQVFRLFLGGRLKKVIPILGQQSIPFDVVLLLIYFKRAQTYAMFKPYWDMRAARPLKSIPMCCLFPIKIFKARLMGSTKFLIWSQQNPEDLRTMAI